MAIINAATKINSTTNTAAPIAVGRTHEGVSFCSSSFVALLGVLETVDEMVGETVDPIEVVGEVTVTSDTELVTLLSVESGCVVEDIDVTDDEDAVFVDVVLFDVVNSVIFTINEVEADVTVVVLVTDEPVLELFVRVE